MFKVSFLEFIIRGIPEGLIFFLTVYAFTRNKINIKRYFLSSIIYSIVVYLIKFLPIQNGADYILNLIVLMALTIIVDKIDIIKSIRACISIMVIEFICEGANVFFIQSIMKKDINELFKDTTTKILYSYPSLLILGCIAAVYYVRLLKRKELNNISYGKINE